MPNGPGSEARTARPTLGHVGALDGIRALAVIAVVLYHAGVAHVHAGYLGVDVFFVLSGFLITSLLLTELEGRGRLAFGRFYERRARRLLPALVVLVVLVVCFAWVVAPHASYPRLPGQLLGTMAYVGNWTLIAGHVSYFSQGLPPSPVEHTWSLAIEEQFYLVWPAMLFALWRLNRRRGALATWCVALSAACAALSAVLVHRGASVDALYFSTEAHATTMLLGAALACVLLAARAARTDTAFASARPSAARWWNLVGVVAWTAVVVTFVAADIPAVQLFDGGYFAFGVLVATAICATVLVPDGPSSRALALAPVAFVGRVSYGIYLFHFPLFIWIDHQRTGLSGAGLLVARLAVTLAVAVVSYEFIERPIRERRWIRGTAGLVGSIAAFCGIAVVAFAVTSAAATVPFADRVAKWNPAPRPPAGATTRVLVVGDSMAQTLGYGLNNLAARAAHVYFGVVGDPKCSLVPTEMRVKGVDLHPRRRCSWSPGAGLALQWGSRLASLHPALSMLLTRLDIVDHRLAARWVHVGNPTYDCELRARLLEAAALLSSTGRPVVVLTTPFYSTGEQTNGATWPEDHPARVRAYNRLLRQLARAYPGVVHVVDLNAMLSPRGAYARTIGATVVRWVDGVHLTYGGDAYLLPRLLPSIRSIAAMTPTAASLRELRAAARSASPAACIRR